MATVHRPAVASVIIMVELEELVLTPDERARGVRVDSVLFGMDWTGEEHPGQLAAFVAGRVRAFGAEPTDVDTTVVYQAAEADPTLRRGDFPIRQLDHLAGVLAHLGCTLAVWDNGTDTYEILVALTGGDELTGLTYQGLPVRAWGSDTRGDPRQPGLPELRGDAGLATAGDPDPGRRALRLWSRVVRRHRPPTAPRHAPRLSCRHPGTTRG